MEKKSLEICVYITQALILVNTAGEVTVPSILRYNELREEQSVNSFRKILIIEHVGLLQATCEDFKLVTENLFSSEALLGEGAVRDSLSFTNDQTCWIIVFMMQLKILFFFFSIIPV